MLKGFFRKRLPYRVSGKSWLLVAAQLGAIGYLSFSAPLISRSLEFLFAELAGILLMFSGIIRLSWISFSVFPEPRPDGRLETSGIYSVIRHPMYAGLLLISAVLVLDFPSIFRLLAWLLLVAVLLKKISQEEKWLTERYLEFAEWAGKTDRLIPFLW